MTNINVNTVQMTQTIVPKQKNDRLMETCRDFEAIFIKQMLNTMKKTVNKTNLLGGNMAEDVFEDMLYDEYSKLMAKNANFGLAEMMYDQLSNIKNIKR